jgi:hypothetical protein
MNNLPLTPEIAAIAKRVVWFEEPEAAVTDPIRFVAYAMTYGRYEDISVLRKYLTESDLREALANAPPGVFDERSWSYWNLMLDRWPPPPMPERRIPEPPALGSLAEA